MVECDWEPELLRELIFGMLLVEENKFVNTVPIVSRNNMEVYEEGEIGIVNEQYFAYGDLHNLRDGEIKGVLPVPFPTYQVSVLLPVSIGYTDLCFLGYEYPTLPPRNWNDVIVSRIKDVIEDCKQEDKEYLQACIDVCRHRYSDKGLGEW
jgi:hypothetical protein